MRQKHQKKKNAYKRLFLLLLAFFIGICTWKGMRATSTVPFLSYTNISEPPYSEKEKVMKAISLSYLVYGCETINKYAGTINEILEQHKMGILIENFGIKRQDETDATTAIFDSSQFIREQVGDFRFLTAQKHPTSSFFGTAFCDDVNKCVWISYSGSVSFKDCFACAELVFKPDLSSQEEAAFALYETVMASDEVKNQSYHILLTGHSLGGALASMVSCISGCEAITINGADGLAIDKINGIVGEAPKQYKISNYMTSPRKESFSFMNLVQRLMFLGSYQAVDCHVYEKNGLTTDTHSVFSFVTFSNENYSAPEIPDCKK